MTEGFSMSCVKRLAFCGVAWAAVGIMDVAAQDIGAPSSEWQEPYDEGVQLIEQGKYREAIEALNRAILAIPELPAAYIAKADALKELGDYNSAAAAYTQAINIDVRSSAAYTGRGECFMEMTPPDYNLAVTDFNSALDLDRGNAQALSSLGHIYVNFVGDPQLGLDRLEEALALNPQDARAHRDSGLAHAQLREFDKAASAMGQAIALDPGDYENYWMQATVYLVQNKYAEGAEALGQAINAYKPKKRIDPQIFIMGYIGRADARLKIAETETDPVKRQAALEGVIVDANRVLDLYEDRFPESGRALFRRGRAERMLERYTDAIDTFTDAIQMVPAGQSIEYLSEAYMYRGICWYYIESYELARGDFEQASAIGSGFQDPRVFLWIGFTHHKQGDHREAIEAYSQAIAKAPDLAIAHVNKGRAYMDLREYNKAAACFSDAIRSEPEVGEHYYQVAVACNRLEDFDKARNFLSLALKKENPQPKMYRAMATALRGLGQDSLAEEYDRQAENPPAEAATGG
jgi:tetratricopeptide (TPR) repeat protein